MGPLLNRLARAIRVASAPAMLLMGALGWCLIGAPWLDADGVLPWSLTSATGPFDAGAPKTIADVAALLGELARLVATPFTSVIGPWVQAARSLRDPAGCAISLARGIWSLAVWVFLGAAMCRIAAPALVRRERPGIIESLSFTAMRFPRLIGTALSPWIGITMCALLILLVGVLYRIPWGVGDWLGGGLSFLGILLAVPLAWLLLVTAASWPLMTATVAVDDGDSLEAVSRGYGYVIQRPALYAASLVAALLVGMAGWCVADVVYRAITGAAVFLLGFAGGRDLDTVPGQGLELWLNVARWLALGWLASYSWTALTAVYLGLRESVDGTPVDYMKIRIIPAAVEEASEPTPAPAEAAPVSPTNPAES